MLKLFTVLFFSILSIQSHSIEHYVIIVNTLNESIAISTSSKSELELLKNEVLFEKNLKIKKIIKKNNINAQDAQFVKGGQGGDD